MRYANIITNAGQLSDVPGAVYGGIDYHGSPPWGVAMAAGWRKLDDADVPNPPEGQRLVSETYTQDAGRPDYAVGSYVYKIIPEPYPAPDTTVPILDASGNQTGTARIIVDTDLNIIAVVNSASPQKPWSEQKAAYVAKQANRKAMAVTAADSKTKAETANSVPALRAEVARLAELIKQLTEGQ